MYHFRTQLYFFAPKCFSDLFSLRCLALWAHRWALGRTYCGYIRIVWTLWKRIWILFANMCEFATFHHGLLTILYDVTFPSFARTHECLFKVQGKTTQSNESRSMKVIFSTWCRSLPALKNVYLMSPSKNVTRSAQLPTYSSGGHLQVNGFIMFLRLQLR